MFKRIFSGVVIVSMLMVAFAGCGGQTTEIPMPETKNDQLLSQISKDDPDYYEQLARLAVDDIIANWWMEDEQKMMPTHTGISAENAVDPRGAIWERAMLLFPIYDMWQITGEEYYEKYLAAEAKAFRDNYNGPEMDIAAGNNNWAVDDCAWNSILFLMLYNVTGDEWFVERSINLLDDVVDRWYDSELNGLYYKDGVDFMALYEVGAAMSWLRLWELTGEQRFYDLAYRSYDGMHTRLVREDGIYWCEANIHWPVNGDIYNIHEGGSSSFLAGNMAMASLSAMFYRITGEQVYLDRVYATNEGLLKFYDNDGVLLNDRDAWTNGTFASVYAAEVLSLPGTEQMQTLLKNTADSIVRNARTPDGYYGGSWSGPADGSMSTWYSKGSVPRQSMTTGSSVQIVVAAAVLEAQPEHYTR